MKRIILLLIFVISLTMFFISGYNIVTWIIDKSQTKENIEEIYDNVVINEIPINDEKTSEENTTTNQTTMQTTNEENPYLDYMNMSLIDVDFNKLKSTNSDVKGWIKVEGTNINYPFVQTNDNNYYLTHTFDKSYNKAGWVFVDYRNNTTNFDQNTIIYAHGRVDNTMFGSLRNTLKTSWFNKKNNHVIKISTENENSLWQIFSVYKIPTTNDYLQINFSDSEFKEFTNKIINRSMFNFNTQINSNDKIITLSTCHNSTYKIVMHAKLIKTSQK